MRLLLLFLYICQFGYSQTPEIRINPGGHMALIRDLEVSHDGRYAFTASFDKSIKQWDLTNGKVIQEFRGQIGYGAEGMVYEIAISPDDKFIAVGGWFGKDDETEILGDIRLYNIESGRLEHVFKGLENIPVEIAFLNNGKEIMAADQSSSIFVWDLSTKSLALDLKFHSKNYGEALYEASAKGNYIFSVDELGNLALWDISESNSRPKANNTKDYKKILKNINASMAICPIKQEVVISADKKLYFFDFKLKLINSIELDFHPGFLEYNQTGDLLFHGNVGTGGSNVCSVLERNGRKWNTKYKLEGHKNAVLAGKLINDNEFITSGGEREEVRTWKIENNSVKNVLNLHGNGRSFYGVAVNKEHLALAAEWNKRYGLSNFSEGFNLFFKENESLSSDETFPRAYHSSSTYKISTVNEGDGVYQNKDLYIDKNGIRFDTITREWWFGDRHNCFSLTPEDYILSGGSQGVLEAFNTMGFPISNFVGHESDIWSIGFNKDTSRMITCSADQTIRIWDLSEIGKLENDYPPYTIEEYYKRMEIWDPFKQLFKQANILDITGIKTYEAWSEAIDVFEKIDYPKQLLEKKYYDFRLNTIYPLVSIYINEEGEWVIWNNDGYFTSSLKGARQVGFHLNKGQDKDAQFFPFEQFDLKYNRPDIILDELDMGYEEYIPLYKKAYEKRLNKMGYSLADLGDDFEAPELKITDTKRVKNICYVRICATDENVKLKKLNIYNNDVPVFGRDGLKVTQSKTIDTVLQVPLANGMNKISTNIENKDGARSLSSFEYIDYSSQAQKSNLYVISLGVSKYEDENYNLKFAAKDANDINTFFAGSKNYNEIKRLQFVNEQVNKKSLDSIKACVQCATVNDVVIFFIAGHGVLDKDYNYIYATHDIDFKQPELKGISFSELEEILDLVKSHKKLLLMDTCHSGEFDKDELNEVETVTANVENIQFRSVGSRSDELSKTSKRSASEMSKALFTDLRKGTGTTIISSAGGVEFAFESSAWNNGLFTYCLLNSLANKGADENKDEKVRISELRKTLQEEVYELSKGFQRPTMRLSNIETDFIIWSY